MIGELFQIQLAPGAPAPLIRAGNERFRQTDDRVDPMEDHRGLRIGTERHIMVRPMLLGCGGIHRRAVAPPHALVLHPPPQDV